MTWRALPALLCVLRATALSDTQGSQDPASSPDLMLLQFEHSLKPGAALDPSGTAMEVSATGEVTPVSERSALVPRDAGHVQMAALREQLAGRVNESGPIYDKIASCFRAALPQTDEAVAVPSRQATQAHQEAQKETLTQQDLQKAVTMILAMQARLGGNASRPLTDFVDCVSSSGSFINCLVAVGKVLNLGPVSDAITAIQQSGCTNFDGCLMAVKDGLTTVVKKAWDWIKSQASQLYDKIVSSVSAAVGKVTDWMTALYNEGQKLWDSIKTAVATVVDSIGNFFKSLPPFKKFDLGEVCTPENVGFWGMQPTDCGAFSDLGQMFTDVCRIDAHGRDFGDKIATCFKKTGLFGIPTPFFDMTLTRFCLPQFIVTPMEYLIGAAIWGQSFVSALIDAATSIYNTIKDFVTSKLKLFQLGRAVAERRSGRTGQGRGLELLDRAGEDLAEERGHCGPESSWHFTISFGAKLSIGIFKGIFGATPSMGVVFVFGCKNDQAQKGSMLFKLGFTAAVDIMAVKDRKKFEPKPGRKVDDFLSSVALKYTIGFGWSKGWPKMYKGRVAISSDMGVEGGFSLALDGAKIAFSAPISFNLWSLDSTSGDFSSKFLEKTNWVTPYPTGFDVGFAREFGTTGTGELPSKVTPEFEVNAGISFKFCLINCESFEVAGGGQVRYVKMLQNTDCLQISFLEVFGSSGGNLALNKLATTNGGYGDSGGNPMNAVTGTAGTRNHPGEFHGNCNNGNWWMVDLGSSNDVNKVVYYNRNDCCRERAASAVIQLLDASQNVLASKPLTGDAVQTLTFTLAQAGAVAATGGQVQYVKMLQNTDCLQISFLEVFGSSGGNLALNKVATTNGGYGDSGGNPMNAVTGTAGTRNHPGEFHGNCNNGNWWMVNLGSSNVVNKVVYYNRNDCCRQRAASAVIQLLDASQNVLASKPLTGDAVQTLTFTLAQAM